MGLKGKKGLALGKVYLPAVPIPFFPARVFLPSVPPASSHWWCLEQCPLGSSIGTEQVLSAASQVLQKLGDAGDHGKDQKLGSFAFQVLTDRFFFLPFFFALSTNSLRLKKPKVKFVLILNLPLCLPCNFHSTA